MSTITGAFLLGCLVGGVATGVVMFWLESGDKFIDIDNRAREREDRRRGL